MRSDHVRSTPPPVAGTQVRPGVGHGTSTPAHIPALGWKQVLRRCFWRVFDGRLLGEAAAIAFYALLAIFPTLAALISLCGLVIDPAKAAQYFQSLAGMLPAGSAEMAGGVLERTATHGGGQIGLSLGLAEGELPSLWWTGYATLAARRFAWSGVW